MPLIVPAAELWNFTPSSTDVLSTVLTTVGFAEPGNSVSEGEAVTVRLRPADGVSRLTLSSVARVRIW